MPASPSLFHIKILYHNFFGFTIFFQKNIKKAVPYGTAFSLDLLKPEILISKNLCDYSYCDQSGASAKAVQVS